MTLFETTHDHLLGGRVRYEQPAVGYRVALEAPLLARFAIDGRKVPFRSVLDLGAGPGAIALMLLATGWASRAVALEPQAVHAALAADNARANGLADRFVVVRRGVAGAPVEGRAELAIANPPYFDEHGGALAPEPTRGASRALRQTSIAAFCKAGARSLGRGGRLVVAFPAARACELLEALASVALVAKRMRFVYPRAGREAQVVFVEAKPARPGGLVVEPPLLVRGEGEAYAPAVDDALRGRWPVPRAAVER